MEFLKDATAVLKQALVDNNYDSVEPKVLFSDDLEKGDLYSTIAMQIKSEKPPVDIANELCNSIKSDVFNVVIEGNFINFFIKEEYLEKYIDQIKNVGWGKTNHLKGEIIIVEHTDPNPFKIFHIGHLMTNAIGESLANLFENAGAKVIRACYMGDVGKHIAKAIWGLNELGIKELTHENIGKAYTYGTQNEEKGKEKIEEINKKIFDKEKDENWNLYEKGRKITLDEFEKIYKRLGTKFDKYFFESEVAGNGKDIVEKNIGDVFIEDSGSIIYRGEKEGLHTRVYITSQGIPTYEAKELGLAFEKEKINHTQSYIVIANEVKDYFKVHLSVISKLNKKIAEKTKPIFHGVMRLADGKMSSREGNIVSANEILDILSKKATNKAKENNVDLSNEDADVISVAAFRYMVLRQSPNKNIQFDIEKSISFTGDSGVYLLYTVARINSLLEKGNVGDKAYIKTEVARLIPQFDYIVGLCVDKKDVHYLTQYLLRLAISFNNWYANERFLDNEETGARLATAKAVLETLSSGLKILGIKVLHKM